MKRLWICLLSIPLFAGIAPDRYIVELAGESAGQFIARTFPPNQRRDALLGAPGLQARARVRSEQAAVRTRLARRGARIVGSVDTLANAIFVTIPAARVSRLRSVRGVKRILPERTYQLTLDHALPLHKVPQAWSLGGAYPQGQGIRIGMIDTGIQVTHPGFNDTGFQAPSGFPVATPGDTAFTNQKVIVARSYVGQCLSSDPDTSAQDDVGHGTSTAMAAAGVQNTGPLATITGVAPLAYLGNYKVFGSPGVNDETDSCAIDMAAEDAVNDGMDVINLSLGGAPALRVADDTEVQVLESAISMGVMVVIAAGNDGPDPNTIGSPGTTPDAITMGAMNNDRDFAAPFTVGGNGPYAAIPGDETLPTKPITAPLVDISLTLDSTGLACNPLPANSLKGSIALILRGTCTFNVKLDAAQQAGAVAALIYTYASSPAAITMDVGTATLPGEMVSNQDGLTIKQFAANAVEATMSFSQAPFAISPYSIASFSSLGPSVDLSIKPDLLAVGENFYTAAETTDGAGELYNAQGYVVSQGTSYSTPLVTGAAAVLKAARPGFTPLEYKSLLVNSAAPAFPSQPQSVQNAGAGMLDLNAAMLATLAVNPASISFGLGSGTSQISTTIRLSNLGYDSDTFQISMSPAGSAPAPVPAVTSVQLDSDTYFDLPLTFSPSGLAPGEYEGFIVIQAASAGTVARIPYWYGVASSTAAHITILYVVAEANPSASLDDAFLFRVTDSSGIIVGNVVPKVTVSSGSGSVQDVHSEDDTYPGVWGVNLRMGPTAGASNVFQITAGGLTQTVTIVAE